MGTNDHNRLKKWMQGISYETAFWNNVYRWDGAFHGMMNWSHYGSYISLEGFDANAFLLQEKTPLVLDVGAGMSYAPGNYLKNGEEKIPLDIHYVDPLAYQFNRILRRHKRPLPSIEFGMVEYLSSFYPAGKASLITIQNALDHSAHPMKGIFEAMAVLKIGGVLYLNHHPNEAVTENYKGFHQYNIMMEDNHLIIWNLQERICVDEMVSTFATVRVSQHKNGHIIAVVKKTSEVPFSQLEERHDREVLCTALMNMLNSLSAWQALQRTCTYWRYNLIQYLAQSLPWETKMRIKSLFHKS